MIKVAALEAAQEAVMAAETASSGIMGRVAPALEAVPSQPAVAGIVDQPLSHQIIFGYVSSFRMLSCTIILLFGGDSNDEVEEQKMLTHQQPILAGNTAMLMAQGYVPAAGTPRPALQAAPDAETTSPSNGSPEGAELALPARLRNSAGVTVSIETAPACSPLASPMKGFSAFAADLPSPIPLKLPARLRPALLDTAEGPETPNLEATRSPSPFFNPAPAAKPLSSHDT